MHKIKTATKALRTHLHRDSQGIKLLDDVARIANELRSDARELSEKLESATQTIERLRRELQDAERTIKSVTDELFSECRSRLECERKLKSLAKEKQTLEEQLEPPRLDPQKMRRRERMRIQSFVTLFKRLRSVMPSPPIPSVLPKRSMSRTFDLHDIVEDFSDSELCRLGMLVAVLVLMGINVGIGCEDCFDSWTLGAKKESGGEPAKLLRWARDAWITDPTAVEKMADLCMAEHWKDNF